MSGAANGASKYDSLQIKVNKRFSHGLQANGNFTWAQGFTRGNPQDFFNWRSSAWGPAQRRGHLGHLGSYGPSGIRH